MTILLLKIFGSLLKIVPQITHWGMFLFLYITESYEQTGAEMLLPVKDKIKFIS